MTTRAIYDELLGKYEPLSIPSIFLALERMEKRKLVAGRKGDPIKRRGGRARLYYEITEAGRTALMTSQTMTDMVNCLSERPPMPRKAKTPQPTPRR